jgi:hypothetical protein
MRSQRWVIRWAPPLAGLVIAGLAAGVVACDNAGGTASHPAATVRSSATVPSSSRAAATAPHASGSLVVGTAYPYRLFIHCGVPNVSFGGRAWRPVQQVGRYQGNRPVNGMATYDGYVTGTMTLEKAGTLRFTADNAITVAPFAVTFEAAVATPGLRPACA